MVHHFILYGVNSSLTEGSISPNCEATSVAGTFVAGWAPGADNIVFDPDVGLVLDYPYYQLQVHYNNQRYADGADASGFAFCSTTTPRQNAAGIVELGSMIFLIPGQAKDIPVTTSCTDLSIDGKTPITVYGSAPHMHKLGSGFRTEHKRGGVDIGDIVNIPLQGWSFDNQRRYDLTPRRQVLPGDTLQTSCFYTNPSALPVAFGTKTSDEMCFNFMTVYPYSAAVKHCGPIFGP